MVHKISYIFSCCIKIVLRFTDNHQPIRVNNILDETDVSVVKISDFIFAYKNN